MAIDPVDALLALAAERPWRQISLRDIAERAGVAFPDLYAAASSKTALVWRLCDGERSVAQIIAWLAGQFPERGDEVARDVQQAIDTLIAEGLLTTALSAP